MQLRPYQQEAKSAIYDRWNAGDRNTLAVLPTGAGKTVLFGSVVHDHQGYSCSIAHRQELVGQISMALAREQIYHRIIGPQNVISDIVQAQTRELGQAWYDPTAKAGVAGVDTLLRRAPSIKDWTKRVGLWVTDEAHHLLEANKWGKAAALFPNARGLGVTATPLRADGAGLGRHADGVFDSMIEGPSMRWLIDQKFLTDYRVFAPPPHLIMDDSDIGSTGDYKQHAVATKFRQSKNRIIGDIVGQYLRIAPSKRGVVFVPDVEDAIDTAAAFNAAGIPAEAVSAKTPSRDRTAIINRFRRGDLTVLVNVDLFGEGFDLPAIEVVQMARPTMSYALYAQQFGRALRLMEGKTEAIIIDHVGNVQRHGLPDRQRIWTLDRVERGDKQSKDPDLIPTKSCQGCTAVYYATHMACPYCGHINEPAGRSRPDQVDGDLLELDPAVLAEMRAAIDAVDKPPADLRARMQYAGAPMMAVNGAVKNHGKRQDAQQQLRDIMAMYGGHQKAAGRDKREAQKRFFWKYGVDVLSAQALGRPDAEALTIKIATDLMNGV